MTKVRHKSAIAGSPLWMWRIYAKRGNSMTQIGKQGNKRDTWGDFHIIQASHTRLATLALSDEHKMTENACSVGRQSFFNNDIKTPAGFESTCLEIKMEI